MPRNQRYPTPAELDERVKLDLEPDEAIRLIMETGEGDDSAVEENSAGDLRA